MSTPRFLLSAFVACAVFLSMAYSNSGTSATLSAQGAAKVANPITGEGLPNPAPKVTRNWGELPAGRKWGTSAGLDIDPKDGHVWGYERCGAGHGRRRSRRLRQQLRSIPCSSSTATPARCWRTSARASW